MTRQILSSEQIVKLLEEHSDGVLRDYMTSDHDDEKIDDVSEAFAKPAR